ncbi:eukaryotic glutathione synthase, ATP binding domain protein [Cooperia oncophora]
MGAHAERVTKMHRRTMAELGYDKETIEKAIPKKEKMKLFSEPSAVVLVVVENVNQNQIDQRHVEYMLEDMGVPVDQIVRRTLTECYECLTLSPERHLLLSGSRVAVVYFRAGYSPDNYLHLRRVVCSTSDGKVRCDQIAVDWSSSGESLTKKNSATEDGVVERFIGHPREAAAIRATFAGLWAINNQSPITEKLVKSAIAHPNQFVLKPQTEGGGGNFYGEKMVEKLKTMTEEERGAHILMERIQPLVLENYLVRAMQSVQLLNVVKSAWSVRLCARRPGYSGSSTRWPSVTHKGRESGRRRFGRGQQSVIDSPFCTELL